MKNNTYIKAVFGIMILMICCTTVIKAQLNPLRSMYFQNQYLGNPAMAGLKEEFVINLAHSKQWSSFPGAPTTQVLTADYGFANRVGVGLMLQSDKSGLQEWTSFLGTYSYHIPMNDRNNQRIHFGVSLGISNERIAEERVNGNSNDIVIGDYNQRKSYIDGDAGIAYTSDKLSLQAAIPDLKTFTRTDVRTSGVDRPTFFGAASYKFVFEKAMGGGIRLEPKVCFRGVKGFDNLVDAGANIGFIENRLNLMAMYHSNNSGTIGVGIQYKALNLSTAYSTATYAMKSYAGGNFEVNLRVTLQ